MARGYAQSRSETDFRERDALAEPGRAPASITEKVANKEAQAAQKIVQGISVMASNGKGVPMDAIVENVAEKFLSMRDYLSNEFSDASIKTAAGLATDMTELALMKADRDARVAIAKGYGPNDEEQVSRRMDEKIAETTRSVADGILQLGKQVDDAKFLTKQIAGMVETAIREATTPRANPANESKMKYYKPNDIKQTKVVLNDLYEELIK